MSGHYFRPSESEVLQDYVTHAEEALTLSENHHLKKRNPDDEISKLRPSYLNTLNLLIKLRQR